MNPKPDSNWMPDPQLLAAYFDGELEGRDDVADVRARIEAWLEQHPGAGDEWTQHHRLQILWEETTPSEPSTAAWDRTLAAIGRRRHAPLAPTQRAWWMVGIIAASIALCFGLAYGVWRSIATPIENDVPIVIAPQEPAPPKKVEEFEVFAVATADEIVVRRIDGADTSLVTVGRMPLDGPLELAGRGDIRVVRVDPDLKDKMRPTVRTGGTDRPMIYAKMDTE